MLKSVEKKYNNEERNRRCKKQKMELLEMKTQTLNENGFNNKLETSEEKISEFEDIREMIQNELKNERKAEKNKQSLNGL